MANPWYTKKMIEQNAVVIRTEGDKALVEVQRQSACGTCHAKQGCGTGMLQNSVGKRAMRMMASNRCDAHNGDDVVVAVPERGFIKTAFFTYFLPLLLMLLGAIVAQQMDWSSTGVNADFGALAGAVAGFIISLLLLRQYSKKIEKNPELHPVIIRKVEAAIKINVRTFRNEQHPF